MGEIAASAAPVVRRRVPGAVEDRLIVALDVPTIAAARELVAKLDGIVSFFKIGLWLLYAPGCEQLIDDLVRRGKRVFLDSKMYDIGETVRQGVARAAARGVSLVTVHGDADIMRAAVAGKGGADLMIFAITALTSLNEDGLRQLGFLCPVDELIGMRVKTAAECGCDGVIAAAQDNPDALRRRAGAPHLLIGTPGIRPAGTALDDHKRSGTPGQAIAAGADFLVVGRPIVQHADPAAQARRIVDEMRAAL